MRIKSLISALQLKIMYLVLSGLKLSLFLLNQRPTFPSASFILSAASLRVGALVSMVVSSAKFIKLADRIEFFISFTYIKNKIGPN